MIINGNIELYNCTNLKSLGKLKRVEGDLVCPDNIKDLGDLKYVGYDLDLRNCINIKSLGNLKEVGRNLAYSDDLEYIGGHLDLRFCINLKSLGKLKEVSGNIYLKDSSITEEYVEENYYHLLDKCIF